MTSPVLTPRRATPDDAAACAKVVDTWITATPWMPDSPGLLFLTDVIAKGIPLRDFWVIGSPVEGYLSLDPEISQINGLYCARPGAGRGKALMQAAKEGRDFVQLWTHEPNLAAQRFYRREGFDVVDRAPEGRGDGVPELRMEWRA